MIHTYDIDKNSSPYILQAFSELKRKEIPVFFLAASLPDDPEGGLWYLYTFDYEYEQPGLRAYYRAGLVAEGCYDAISAETDDFAGDIARCVESHYNDIMLLKMNEERIP